MFHACLRYASQIFSLALHICVAYASHTFHQRCVCFRCVLHMCCTRGHLGYVYGPPRRLLQTETLEVFENQLSSHVLWCFYFFYFCIKNDRATTRPCWGGSKGISRHFWLTAKLALIQKPYILTLMATLPINVTLATHARDDPTPGGPIRLPLRDA